MPAHRLTLHTLPLVCLAFADSQAQSPAPAPLPPIAVEAERESGRIVERADRFEARELTDLFAREPEANVGGGVRQGRRLHLRGIEASNLRITVDGAGQGQNLYNHRGGAAGIDPFLLKSVEITPGVLPADAGPGGLGGAIRFTTLDAQDLLADGRRFGASLRLAHASAARARTANLAVYGLPTPTLGLLAYAGGTDAENLRIGGGTRTPFSGYEDRDRLVKLSQTGRTHTFRLGHNENRTDGLNFQQRGDFPVELQPPFATRPPRDQRLERKTTTFSWRIHPETLPLLDLELALYRNDAGWRGATGSGAAEVFDTEKTGASLKNRFQFTHGRWHHALTAGLDREREQGEARVGATVATPYANRFVTEGVFAQHRAQSGRLWVSAGVRHDRFDTRYRTVGYTADATSANASAGYELLPGLEIFGGYGEAARAAGTLPVHFAQNVQPTASVPRHPERARNIEAGVRWTGFTPVLGGQPSAGLTLYRNRIEHFIVYTHGGSGGLGNRPVIALFNQDEDIVSRGGTLRLGWQDRATRIELSHAVNRLSGLPRMEQFFARAGAPTGDTTRLDVLRDFAAGWSAGYTLTRVADLDRPRQNQSRLPGYTLHDLSLRYAPPAWTGLELTLAITNLTDRRYASHSTLTQAGFVTFDPGRDVRASLRYTF